MDPASSFVPRRRSSRLPPPWLRHAVVWTLVLALALYGYSGVLAGALGSLHRHAEPAVALQGTVTANSALPLLSRLAHTVRSWHENAQAQRHALFAHDEAHPHHHGLFERHHHDANDASVVALGAQTSGSDPADETASTTSSCIGSLTICPLPNLDVPSPSARHTAWPDRASDAWRSAELKLVERPPRA